MEKKDVFELTNPQKSIFELEQVNGKNSSINHITSTLKLKGQLNENLLIKTINKIIENNDSFRLGFNINGNEINQYIKKFEYQEIDVEYFEKDDISTIVNEYKKFDISLEKPYRFKVVFTPNYTYILYKTHHIIADAWSISQVAEQIKEFYEKLEEGITEKEAFEKPSYIDFINREKLYLQSEKYNIDKEFWNNYVLQINTEKKFDNNSLDKNISRYTQPISKELSELISEYCKKNKISEYVFFLAIFSIYFNKIYDYKNITLGTPFLNRQKRFKELETVGMFVSTLPLAIKIDSNDTFISLCKNIANTNMSIYKHSSFPYEQIQKLYSNNFKQNANLYEIGFSYQINKQEISMNNNDFGECSWLPAEEQNSPLIIHITAFNNCKVINYDYWASSFNKKEIEKMYNTIICLIYNVIKNTKNIRELNILTDEDFKDLIEFNNTGNISKKQNTVVKIFNDIVKKYPNKIAITIDNQCITYQDLNAKIDCVAKKLIDIGVERNIPVALFLDKSIEMIVAMIAVLKAGGCYVPILPEENSDRIKYIINDCTPKCILTHKNYEKKLPTNQNIINMEKITIGKETSSLNICNKILPTDTAYIIYTSGSTGNPKGTMVMHQNICSLVDSIKNDSVLKASDKDVSMSLLKYSFDASGIDIYTSLLFGGKLVLVSKDMELNPQKVVEIIEKEKVTRSFLIPKWIEHIAIQDKISNANLSTLRILGTGGETLKPYIIGNLLSKYSNLKILNLYGPTETTMFTTYKEVGLSEIKNNYTSIGRPIYGSRIGVINSELNFLPIETKGELIIYEDDKSICNIAKGYLNLKEQTQNKFIEIYNPVLKKKIKAYRTGDIAKINKNLEIEFISRNDDVVKVNGGYLIALNEVENRIQQVLGNDFCICPVAIPYKNTKIIILFFTTKEINIDSKDIKTYIDKNISFYMRPKKFIKLEDFPRNNSGKIDKKKLERMAIKYIKEEKKSYIKPSTPTEIYISNYVSKLTNKDDISVIDDFINDLNIDSLTLTAIYAYLDDYNITMQDIYNNCNIHDLAKFIDEKSSHIIEPNLDNISNIKILNNVKKFDLKVVLITGVTGFLGIHLLRDLLLNKDTKKVYCIIRNKINLNGKERLAKMIDFYFDSDKCLLDLISKKVIVINGNISRANLGIDSKIYEDMKKEVTTVINSAANVKHFAKLEEIKKDNVDSVNNLMQFCENSISLAHISTLSIAGFHNNQTETKNFDENTLYINQEFCNNPYLITKFEAEKNILEATKNGLNAVIFRLGNIMPRYSDGKFQKNATQNVFLSALKSIIDSKVIAIDFLELRLEFSPVDICSKAILGLLENNNSKSIYHILSNKEISVGEIKNLLKKLNYNISNVNMENFVNEINNNADEYTKEYILNSNLNKYSQNATLTELKKINIEWPCIDINYMKKIINIIKSL